MEWVRDAEDPESGMSPILFKLAGELDIPGAFPAIHQIHRVIILYFKPRPERKFYQRQQRIV